MAKIISPMQHQEVMQQVRRDAMLAKLADKLITMHDKFLEKADEIKSIVETKTKGDKGDSWSRSEVMEALNTMIPSRDTFNANKQMYISMLEDLVLRIKDKQTLSRDEIQSLIISTVDEIKDSFMPSEELLMKLVKRGVNEIDLEKIAGIAAGKVRVPNPEKLNMNEIVSFLKSLPPNRKLGIKDIQGVNDFLLEVRNEIRRHQGGKMRGGGDTLQAATGYTITRNTNGTVSLVINASATRVGVDKLTGTQSGQAVTLNLATATNTPVTVFQVTRQGQILTPVTSWSVAGTTLTINADVQADASEEFVILYTY